MTERAATAPARGHELAAGVDPVRFADLLAGYCLDVQPGQTVLVRSTTEAAPLLLEVQRAVLQRDAWPLLRVELPGQGRGFLEHARDLQLDDVPGLEVEEAERVDALLGIQAPAARGELEGVDPARVARLARARQGVRERTMGRRWCSTLWPTPVLAQGSGMAPADYEAFVARALFLDREDPVRAWRELAAFQDRVIERVRTARTLRIEAESTDISLGVAGRTWVNSDGRRNMPSGEVFTGPHETSANGTVRFTVRSAPAGLDVDGVELTFRDGVVVGARAEVGEEHLLRALDTDAGARRLGEVGIGTNPGIDRPTGTILFDEKIGGTVHLALGRSYPETGGTNESAVHWDLICDLRRGGRLTADGEVVQQDGEFRL